jgi:hypothetical protein
MEGFIGTISQLLQKKTMFPELVVKIGRIKKMTLP